MRDNDLTYARTNAIAFSAGPSSEKPLHYFERWHTLKLRLSDYDLVRAVGGMEQDFGKNIFRDFEGDGWMRRTEEGFAQYNKLRLAQLKPAPERTGYAITGIGQIERDKVVCAYVRDPDRPPSDRDDTSYQKSFNDILVSIVSVKDEDAEAGSIFLAREDSGEPRPGKDNLHLTLYMPVDQMRDLIAEIRSSTTRPELQVAAIVALYQSEVEAALRDWHHPQTFLLPEPNALAPARLMQVRFCFDKPEAPDLIDAPEMDSFHDTPQAAVLPQSILQSQSAINLRGIKIALWIIAVATVLGVFVR